MNGWRRIKLEDIFIERKEYCEKNGKYSHITLGIDGLNEKTKRYDRDFLVKSDTKKYKVTHMNDICFNPANLKFGVICMNSYGDGIFSPIYITLELKKKYITDINIKFVGYILTSNIFIEKIRKYEQGTVYERQAVGVKDFLNAYIEIPSIEKQNKIVEILDNVSSMINLYDKKIEYYSQLVKSQFVEMFTGEKAKSWKSMPLKEVCYFNPKKSEISDCSDDMEVSFVSMPMVSEKGEIDASDIKKYEEVKKGFTYFYENDVLFAKITPCMENGKGAVAKGLKNNIGFGSTEFHVIRAKECMNSIWIYTLTSLNSFRKQAEKNMTGSAGQKRVPIAFLENYIIAVPPLELQNQFANFVERIDKLKFELQNQRDNYIKLKKGLMQQLLTGKIRVNI